MDFEIKNLKIGISDLSRKIGYIIIDTQPNGEYNLVRKLTGQNYPRFHAYVKQAGQNFIFSLHLDQKAPIYKPQKNISSDAGQYDWRRGQDISSGVHAHNGEYFGPIIDEEADRIKEIIKNS